MSVSCLPSRRSSRAYPYILTIASFAALTIMVQACGGGGDTPSGPPAQAVASVQISPPTASVLVGATTVLSASVRDATGATVSGRTVLWSSSSSAVATVAGGTVTGVAPGTATITATADGKSGTAQITVNAPQPATIVISAGDNATGEPGKLLPVVPVVTVRSTAGAPVAGVTVQFTVDSGGGTVMNPMAVTAVNGEASVGGWTLGPAEGPQVLSVTVGSLAKVQIRATARVVPSTITSGTVTQGAGTITVNQPTSPLNGLSITFPANAVQTAAPVTLSIASTLGITLRAGQTAASPALVITTTAGALLTPAVIKFPVKPVPGKVLMVGMYNPASGGFTILPPLGSDTTGIYATLPALDASFVPTNPSATIRSARGTAAMQEDPPYLFTIQVDPAVLANDYDSNFRAQRDNWDFDNFAIAWLPFLSGTSGANPAQENIDPSAGMVATSLWYFENQKSGGPLYKRFRKQADQAKSNIAGIRWSALANKALNDPRAQVSSSYKQWISTDPAVFTNTQFKAVKVMFFDSYDRPVPVLLYDIAGTNDAFAVGMGVITRTTGNELELVVPDNKETPYKIVVTASGMTPITVVNRNGSSYRVASFSPINQRGLISASGIGSRWNQVVAGTVGDAEGWPKPELHYKKGKLDTASVFIADKLQHWWECATCSDFGVATPGLPETAGHVQGFQTAHIENGVMQQLPDNGALYPYTTWTKDSVTSETAPTKSGYVIYLPQPQNGDGQFGAGWLDFQTVTYKRMALHPTPADSVTVTKDTTISFSLAPSITPPTGTKFAWVLRTATGRDSVETAVPLYEKALTPADSGMLLIMALEPVTRRVIGLDSVRINAKQPVPYWQITSFIDVDGTLTDVDLTLAGEMVDLLRRLVATPRAGLIAVDTPSAGKTQLRLRALRSGLRDSTTCCPVPAYSAATELLLPLGTLPSTRYTVGPFFSGWETDSWSQSSTELNTGTMTGQYIPFTMTFQVPNQGAQVGPAGGVRTTATRNGTTMTGVVTVFVWYISDNTGELDGDPDQYRFSFTATRLR